MAKDAAQMIGAAVGFIVLLIVIWAIGFGLSWWAAPWQGKLQARQQIQGSGSFRIAAYNHFFDLCAAVQTDEVRLATQKSQLKTASADDKSRIEANIAGITSDRADAINEYNADAEKDYTVGQFKSSKLPFQLSAQEDQTLCVVG